MNTRIPPTPGSYDEERLALWMEVGRTADAIERATALIGATKDKLENDTRKDIHALGEKVRRLENALLVIKTKAFAYGTVAAFVVAAAWEVVKSLWLHR